MRPMHFRLRVWADLESNYGMGATLGQSYTSHLWIGPWPMLIATAPKRRSVGGCVGRVEEGAVNGHQPIAPIKGARHGVGLPDHVTACPHQPLQALVAQRLASSAQPAVADRTDGLERMQLGKLPEHTLPHLALVASAPQRHPDHKQHQAKPRAEADAPRFAGP